MKKKFLFNLIIMLIFSVYGLFSQGIEFGNIKNWDKYPYKTAVFDNDNFKLIWSIQDNIAYIGISAKTTGWVAIGLEPEQAMDKADIIFCRVLNSGETDVTDTFSIGPYGPHPPDTELGGTSDILSMEGIEKDGITTVVFSRKLDTKDKYDKQIPKEGKLKIIWAYGTSDSLDSPHKNTGYAELDMSAGAKIFNFKLYVLIHAILMGLTFLILVSGVLTAHYFKKKKTWLKTHKIFGIAGGILGIAGFLTAYYMIQNTSRIHFQFLHTIIGLAGIIMFILTPLLGQIFLKIRKHKQFFGGVHKISGRITLIIMFTAVVFGLIQAGIL